MLLPSPPDGLSPSGIVKERVLAELDLILSGPAFTRVERPQRFLRHLVEGTLSGQTHLLKESVLGVDVFGRPATWDPRLDPVVRQEAARLRKRLARHYESEETVTSSGTPGVRIELPVGTYVPIFVPKPEPAEPAVLSPEPAAEVAVVHESGLATVAALPRAPSNSRIHHVWGSIAGVAVIVAAVWLAWLAPAGSRHANESPRQSLRSFT